MTPLIVIPAAGASSRMQGRDKLLETVDGKPLLRRQAEAALSTGAPVLICLPSVEGPRADALEGLDLDLVPVPDAAEGMGATLRTAALRAAKSSQRPMAILLPDVPGIGASEIQAVFARFDAAGGNTPVRATDQTGRPGTPLVVPPRLIEAFTRLTGDDGGKGALKGETILTVPLPGDRATRDLDTPEEWEQWRCDTGTPG